MVCVKIRWYLLESILLFKIDFQILIIFNFYYLKLIIIFRINFIRSKFFLFFIKINFKKITKYKSLYVKINSIKIKSNTKKTKTLVQELTTWNFSGSGKANSAFAFDVNGMASSQTNSYQRINTNRPEICSTVVRILLWYILLF